MKKVYGALSLIASRLNGVVESNFSTSSPTDDSRDNRAGAERKETPRDHPGSVAPRTAHFDPGQPSACCGCILRDLREPVALQRTVDVGCQSITDHSSQRSTLSLSLFGDPSENHARGPDSWKHANEENEGTGSEPAAGADWTTPYPRAASSVFSLR